MAYDERERAKEAESRLAEVILKYEELLRKFNRKPKVNTEYIQSLKIENDCLQYRICKERDDRKRLHSELESIKGSVRICCRMRPCIKQ